MGDLNGDGKLDLVVADGYGVSVLLGNGDGTFSTAEAPFSAFYGAYSVVIADLDSDGNLDFAAAGPGGVSIFLGHGDGTFQPERIAPDLL